MSVPAYLLALTGLALLLYLTALPARSAWKPVLNTLFGYGSLLLVNLFSFFTGAAFSLNIVTAVTVGFLGLPGIGLLFALRLLILA